MRDAPPRTLPANAWTPAFEDVERTLSLTTGFSLLPVQVAHTEVASLLAGWFRARGCRVAWVEPDGPEAWRTLRETLLALDPDAIDRVMVIGAEGSDGVATGLQRFNVARDLVRERLRCPLLWCGPLPFLEATWTNAPDFWSIRELTVRLLTPLGELAPTRVSEVNRAFAEEKQRALEALWAVLVRGGDGRELTPLEAYLRLVFAIGFAITGAEARGRRLITPLDAEAQHHHPANRVLFSLYRARFEHVLTGGSREAWKADVESILGTVKEPRVKDRVEGLYSRSEWLRTHVSADIPARGDFMIECVLVGHESDAALAAARIAIRLDERYVWGYGDDSVIASALRAVLLTGNDELLRTALRAIIARLGRVQSPSLYASIVGRCVSAAITLHDREMVDLIVDQVTSAASATNAPRARDLLSIVMPNLAPLLRLGWGPSVRRLFASLAPPPSVRGQRENIGLRAANAAGSLLVGDRAHADAMISECVDFTLEAKLDDQSRYDACEVVLATLRLWPLSSRLPFCERIAANLARFTDTFTASIQKIYETHKILVAERLVDCVIAPGDDETAFIEAQREAFLDSAR